MAEKFKNGNVESRLVSKLSLKTWHFRVELYILSEGHDFQALQLFLLHKSRPGNCDKDLQWGWIGQHIGA